LSISNGSYEGRWVSVADKLDNIRSIREAGATPLGAF
jgi:hypothetical protein